MILQPIKDILKLNELIDKFFVSKTLTNCYLSNDYFSGQIEKNNLTFINTESNLFLLIRKDGFYQLYYYINCLDEKVSLTMDYPVSMEILYRGEKNKPNQIFDYWTLNGFKNHLKRDNLIAMYSEIPLVDFTDPNVVLRYACLDDADKLHSVYLSSFDPFTGDMLSRDDIQYRINSKQIISAYSENELCGFLEFEVKNSIVWLNHIAILENFRGKGISNYLVSEYVRTNKLNDNTKYQLWVIQDNIAAVNLYSKFGFRYNNKSTASMLKI